MQPKSRVPTKVLSRPTADQASFGLAVLLQQILSLIEEERGIEGIAGDHVIVPPMVSSSEMVIKANGTQALATSLVHLNVTDSHLVAEILVDINVADYRYLLLRSAKAVSDEQILSPREREIVRLVARGCPNKTIAEILEISPWTVNTYLRRIFAKLDVTSRAEMVAHSLVIGLLQNTL